MYDQCVYHPCDIPENRDKFANIVLSKKIPVEYYVVTDSEGHYPARRVDADFDDSLSILNQKYSPMGLEFTGEIKGIKNNDLFMMNIGADSSWKKRLESTLVQDVFIPANFDGQKTVIPVKALSVLKGKYDWAYLRQGDVLRLHRSADHGFAADELEEEGLLQTKTHDEQANDVHAKRARQLRTATYDSTRGNRPWGNRPRGNRPRGNRPRGNRPRGYRPRGYRPWGNRPRGNRP